MSAVDRGIDALISQPDRLEMLAKRTLKDGAKTIRLEPETTL